AGLGDTLLISHIREAISGSSGETDHQLIAPVANVVPATNQLLTFGGITWL
ncbi:MAG: baseplate J protein, partial [Pseudomonas sp.]|nr:baseplate J protein [Pseudomonas sp.]